MPLWEDQDKRTACRVSALKVWSASAVNSYIGLHPFNAASLGSFACFLCSVQEAVGEKARASYKNLRVLRHGCIHACVESIELNLDM